MTLTSAVKNGSKYGPARIKQVRDTEKAKKINPVYVRNTESSLEQ